MQKALVVVDYQKDFVDGTLGFAGAEKLEPGIAALVEQYLEQGWQVVFTLDTHGPFYLDSREGQKLPVVHCKKGTPGWELYGSLKRYMYHKDVTLLEKVTFGTLDYSCLRQNPPEEILLVGVVTNMCVLSNAVTLQALFPEAQLVVRGDLCDSFDKELHRQALEVMTGLQIRVE